MKKIKIIALLLVVVTNSLLAQEGEDKTYSEVFDSHSENLIPSRVPTGVLYNRVYPWAYLNQWVNGGAVNKNRLIQAWYELDESQINPDLRGISYSSMKNELDNIKLDEFIIPMLVIDFEFDMIDTFSLTDERMSYDTLTGHWTDNNLDSIPYITYYVSMGGWEKETFQKGAEYILQWNPELFYKNTTRNIQNIKVTIGASTYNLNNSNTTEHISFDEVGELEIEFEFEFEFGDVALSTQNIKVIDIVSYKTLGSCNAEHRLLSSEIPFKGYDESIGTTSHADYHIYYKYTDPSGTNCDNKITNPIIILDGFDPGNNRQYWKIYDHYLTIPPLKAVLGEDLRKLGYDIVFLNFPNLGQLISDGMQNVQLKDISNNYINKVPEIVYDASNNPVNLAKRDGGADYIERNAFLLVKLIQEINATMQANGSYSTGMRIVGPSMGGQISRYALAYMEKQNSLSVPNMEHNAKLWISFDSPHEGATVHIGLQQALYHLGYYSGQQSAKDQFEGQLRSKAARQMLIDQIDGVSTYSNFHGTYYNNLKNNGLSGSEGYPQDLRKIALSNGSGDGNGENGNVHDEILRIKGTASGINAIDMSIKNTSQTGWWSTTFKSMHRNEKTTPWTWNPSPPSSTPSYAATFLPVPQIKYTKQKSTTTGGVQIFWGLYGYYKLIETWRGEFETESINPRGAMEVVSGGYYPFVKEFRDSTIDFAQKAGATITTNNMPYLKTPFIPTISSLGFKNSNWSWNYDSRRIIDNRNLVCTGETHFDNYLVQSTNTEHVSLNQKSIDWVKAELQMSQTTPGCPKICVTEILGSDIICSAPNPNGNFYDLDQFFMPPYPNGFTNTWTASSGLTITPFVFFGFNTATVSVNSGASTNQWIKATITNPCGDDVEITKSIVVVNNNPQVLNRLNFVLNCKSIVRCVDANNQGIPGATYEFSLDGVNYDAPTGTNVRQYPYVNTPFNVWCRVTSPCGGLLPIVFKSFGSMNDPNCSNKTEQVAPAAIENLKIDVYPNPTTNSWNVMLHNFVFTEFAKVQLCDLNGKVLWKLNKNEFNNSNIIIPAQNYSTGVYILKVITDRQTETFKLLKE